MKLIQSFILTMLELSSTLILWNALDFKFKNSRIKNISIVVLAVIITLLTNKINGYIGMTIDYLSLILLVKFAFNISFINAFYEFCVIALLSCIIQLVYTIPVKLIAENIGAENYFVEGYSVTTLTLITSIIICKKAHLDKMLQKFNYHIKRTYILLFNILIYVLISKIMWVHNSHLMLDNIVLLIIIPIALITINIMYFRHSARKIEHKKVIEMHEKYSPIMMNLIEEVRQRQHDFKNHINTIYGISEVSTGDEISENIQRYITSLNGSLRNIDNLIFINNQLLAAILYSKISEAKRNNIKILYDVKLENEDFKINDYELTEIITNLLDNAFEAVANNDEEDREVNISILNARDLFYIEVKNKGVPIEPLNMTQGDTEAMTEIIAKFMPLIKKYSRKLSYDGAESDLIIALIKIIKIYPLKNYIYFEDKNLVSYISKSINHEYIRLSKKYTTLNKTEVPLNDDILTSATDAGFEDHILTGLMLGCLPTNQSYILEQLYINDCQEVTLAHMLNISPQAVNKSKKKALDTLRKYMGDEDGMRAQVERRYN